MTEKTNTGPAPSFDLSDLDAVDTASMTVMVGDKPTDWVWTFAGPGHPATVEQGTRLARERIAREQAQEQAQVNGRKWKAPQETVDEVRQRNVDLVVGRLLGWTPVTMSGKDYPFSRENAQALLLDPRKGSLLVQCLEFLGSEQSFTKRSATA